MSAYTPGPWGATRRYDSNDQPAYSIDCPGPYTLAISSGIFGPEQAEANARLIAAAPELLASLLAVAEDNCGHICDPTGLGATGVWHSEMCVMARAAIAKAEGVTR